MPRAHPHAARAPACTHAAARSRTRRYNYSQLPSPLPTIPCTHLLPTLPCMRRYNYSQLPPSHCAAHAAPLTPHAPSVVVRADTWVHFASRVLGGGGRAVAPGQRGSLLSALCFQVRPSPSRTFSRLLPPLSSLSLNLPAPSPTFSHHLSPSLSRGCLQGWRTSPARPPCVESVHARLTFSDPKVRAPQ